MTTRMPSACLPGVRPPFNASNRVKYPHMKQNVRMIIAALSQLRAIPGAVNRLPRTAPPQGAIRPRPARTGRLHAPASRCRGVAGDPGLARKLSCPHLTACPLAERPINTNLRPMRLGEILDGSFNIYRRHFGLFMRLSLILVWLPAAAGIYLNLRFSSNPFEVLAIFQENIGRSIGLAILLVVVWTACGLLLKAGTIRVISDSYLGREPELGSSLRFGVNNIIPLLLVALSKTLLIILLYGAAVL